MYTPFNSSAKIGAAFIKWINDLAQDIGIDVTALKGSVSTLVERTDRVLEQSQHFDDVDARLVELQEKVKLLSAGSVDGEIIAARNGYASLAEYLDTLDPGASVLTHKETATAGQTVIDISETGTCDHEDKIITFLIDGAPQYSSFNWTNETTITMNDPLEGGEVLVIQFFQKGPSIRSGHSRGHEAGGYDPLDLYKLKNGDIVKQQMEYVQKNAVANWRDVVAYYGVPQRIVSNAAALIQQAIDECAPLDVTVVVPTGEYYMEKPLVAKKGLKMIINKNATFYRYHNDAMLMNGNRGGSIGNNDIWIDGGTWDLRGHLLGYDGSCFAFGYAKNITLRNVTVLNVNYSHGIEIAGVEDGYIEYCTFNGFIDNTGTRGYAESIQVEAGIPGGFPYFGAGNNVNCKNIHITGCTAGPSDVAGTWPVGVGTHSNPATTVAQGVYINDCDYRNVKLTGIVANGYKGLQIHRTKVEAPNGIYIYHDQATKTDFVIRDCEVKAINGAAILISGASVGVIEHNTLDGYANAISITKSKEIDITSKNDLTAQVNDTIAIFDTCSDITAQRNIIRKAGRHGINSYQDVSYLNAYGNEILDVGTNAFNFQGPNVVGVIIEGNKIKDTSLNAVLSASSAVSAMVFTKNYYPASLTNPIVSTAVNSDTTGNKAI